MKKIIAICATAMILLSSCSKSTGELFKPEATGAPYDLYVVISDNLKKSALFDSIKEIFEYPMECTPNGDEYFYVTSMQPNHFVRNVRTLANVVQVEIEPDYRGAPVKMSRDAYARGQVILTLKGQSIEQLCEAVMPMQEKLRDIFVKNEIKRAKKVLMDQSCTRQEDRLMKMHNISMKIPYALKKNGKGEADDKFFWATDDFMEKQSHIIAYSVPYTDQNIFSLEGAVAVRDSVVRENILGGFENSYMTTNKNVVLPQYKAIEVGGKYVGELRGMWRIENGLMAGPFVCHMRLDETSKRVIFVEGFVYAPHDGKRRLLRNLEAALYTLQLPSDNMMSEIEITLE